MNGERGSDGDVGGSAHTRQSRHAPCAGPAFRIRVPITFLHCAGRDLGGLHTESEILTLLSLAIRSDRYQIVYFARGPRVGRQAQSIEHAKTRGIPIPVRERTFSSCAKITQVRLVRAGTAAGPYSSF